MTFLTHSDFSSCSYSYQTGWVALTYENHVYEHLTQWNDFKLQQQSIQSTTLFLKRKLNSVIDYRITIYFP